MFTFFWKPNPSAELSEKISTGMIKVTMPTMFRAFLSIKIAPMGKAGPQLQLTNSPVYPHTCSFRPQGVLFQVTVKYFS